MSNFANAENVSSVALVNGCVSDSRRLVDAVCATAAGPMPRSGAAPRAARPLRFLAPLFAHARFRASVVKFHH